jgi:hypothetical protein
MSRFRKLLELVRLSRRLSREARAMSPFHPGRVARLREAEGYMVKALWIGGRITGVAYREYLADVS